MGTSIQMDTPDTTSFPESPVVAVGTQLLLLGFKAAQTCFLESVCLQKVKNQWCMREISKKLGMP